MVKSPFAGLTDRTPRYSVKEVAEKLGFTTYTVRYYDNAGLIPEVGRGYGNNRLFSDYNIAWLKLIHCLRTTGLPIDEVRHYVQMCLKGDKTIPERAELIFRQERCLREQMAGLRKQMEILAYKKRYYEELLASGGADSCNPKTAVTMVEPEIVPQHERQEEPA